MSVKKEEVAVADVTIGMYVCELDRPWLETPFLMQGFLVEGQEDIKTLAAYCQTVFVDRSLSREDAIFPDKNRAAASIAEFPKPKLARRITPATNRRAQKVIALLGDRPQQHYQDTVNWRSEMAAAKLAVATLQREVKALVDAISAGSSYRLAKLKQAVNPLVSSIERNPDACMWLARLKDENSYIYKHSVATAIWAVAFGRELGLPPHDLKALALGGLLLDVGKLRLDPALLCKSDPLSDEEMLHMRGHVDYSLEALQRSQMLNQDIWDMVAYHHERFDGSGYPKGLQGHDIPLFARIAGIVDSYDAMTSDRPYCKAVSPSFAIRQLYQERNRSYDPVLVEEFIQAVGLYPAGTLVLLSSGEVALVVAEGRTRRLKPQVLLLTGSNKTLLNQLKVINLLDATCPETDLPLEIVQSLEPGTYGLDTKKIAAAAGQ